MYFYDGMIVNNTLKYLYLNYVFPQTLVWWVDNPVGVGAEPSKLGSGMIVSLSKLTLWISL